MDYVGAIVHGAEAYFRAFGLVEGENIYTGDVEFIRACGERRGVSLVYRVESGGDAEGLVLRCLPGLRSGEIPSSWVLTPLTRLLGLGEALLRHGFREVTGEGAREYGMAADAAGLVAPRPCAGLEIRRVATEADLAAWAEVVNTALHGWELIRVPEYSVWLGREDYALYLGLIGGVPAATAAAFYNGREASLEFVSTAERFRGRRAAINLCHHAVKSLIAAGADAVSLRCEEDVRGLYEKLGFQAYYEQRIFKFGP